MSSLKSISPKSVNLFIQDGFYDNRSNSPNFYAPNQNNNNNINNKNYVPSPPPQQQAYQNNQNFQQQQQQPSAVPFFNPLQPNNLFSDPVASMAVKYGANLADQGKDYVAQNVDKWFSISKLKYYFAVDTNYVTKKLLLILFPFFNRDWTLKYATGGPDGQTAVPPKLDTNAPDMYIPVMAFVTYLLIVGVCLGIQEKFSPEQLGIHASSAMGWLIIEVFVLFCMLQILAIKTALKTFDIIAFCGYKYFG
jgi:hypothetical protein